MTGMVNSSETIAVVALAVTDRNGVRHDLQVPARGSLMEALRDNNMDVAAVCGGCCSCGTCHVYIEAASEHGIAAAGPYEAELLDMQTECRPSSRLSCQIPMDPALDGLKVEVAPEF